MNDSGVESLIDPVPSTGDANSGGGKGRSLRRAACLTVGMGFAHALLYILSYYLLQQTPGGSASDAEILEFYSSGGDRRLILVGLYVMPFAGIAFLWFTVALRMWISVSTSRINALYSNVQLVSGIIFIALLFTAGAASAATAASMEFSSGQVDPMIARQLPQLSSTILIVFAMRMAAMFVFTTSSIGRTAGILPRWYVMAGYAVGVFLLLSASLSRVLALVFPVWVFVLCVILITRVRSIPEDATIADREVAP